jgi:hypothetical protein
MIKLLNPTLSCADRDVRVYRFEAPIFADFYATTTIIAVLFCDLNGPNSTVIVQGESPMSFSFEELKKHQQLCAAQEKDPQSPSFEGESAADWQAIIDCIQGLMELPDAANTLTELIA